MAGSAILDPSVLLDSLVPTVDKLRADLHPQFGVRAYRVFTILRTWSGRRLGEGVATDVETEIGAPGDIVPSPKVHKWDGLRYDLAACGLDELGMVKLTEWSLTYTEAEVVGPKATMTKAQEWLIRIDEGHGQESKSRFYFHAKPPYIDREKDISWAVWLRSVQGKA